VLTPEALLFVALGAAAGGFINGLAGTGTALFALSFMLIALDPISAVATVALISVLSGFQGLWIVRHTIRNERKRLFRFLVPGLAGVPLGLALLQLVDAGTLRTACALLLIVYGGYFGFRTALPAFSRNTPMLDSTIGFAGGVLGGAASLSGALPTLWLALRPWPKSTTRAVLQPYNMAILGLTVCVLAFTGAYDATTLTALALAVPVGLISAQIGIAVFHRLSDNGFRRLLIVLTLLMGLGVLTSELI
jgi:uncharacterized membrane protein YfcA